MRGCQGAMGGSEGFWRFLEVKNCLFLSANLSPSLASFNWAEFSLIPSLSSHPDRPDLSDPQEMYFQLNSSQNKLFQVTEHIHLSQIF